MSSFSLAFVRFLLYFSVMNTIDFQLAAYGADDMQDYLVVEIRIDDDLLTDFNVYATDLRAVQESCERPGPHFILTY